MNTFESPSRHSQLQVVKTDAELIALVVKRSETALNELYHRHTPLLRSVIFRIMNNHSDVDDVLQDVFVYVWEHAGAFDPARGHFLGWIITIARRRSLDRVRQRSAYQRATDRLEETSKHAGENTDDSWIVDKEVLHHELRDTLKVSLSELPPHQSEVVVLAFYNGLSQREIAAHLNIPLGTVKTRIELGMKKLSRSPAFLAAA